MKICFITAGPIEWGSSRMRAYWVANELQHRHGVQVIDHSKLTPPIRYPEADVYIWQKVADIFWLDSIPGRHYWDVCDPAWWWQPDYCRQVLEYMEGVVCSSEALANDFREWSGFENVHTIPDRLDLAHFTKQRTHTSVSPVRFVWFGVAVNRLTMFGAYANLERLVANGYNIELSIFDDRPDISYQFTKDFPIRNYHWNLPEEVTVLSDHDIALLPPYPGPWGRVKSNNKMLTAFACGLPVTTGTEYEQLRILVEDADERKWQGRAGRLTVENEYTVDKSAAEWEALLS